MIVQLQMSISQKLVLGIGNSVNKQEAHGPYCSPGCSLTTEESRNLCNIEKCRYTWITSWIFHSPIHPWGHDSNKLELHYPDAFISAWINIVLLLLRRSYFIQHTPILSLDVVPPRPRDHALNNLNLHLHEDACILIWLMIFSRRRF